MLLNSISVVPVPLFQHQGTFFKFTKTTFYLNLANLYLLHVSVIKEAVFKYFSSNFQFHAFPFLIKLSFLHNWTIQLPSYASALVLWQEDSILVPLLMIFPFKWLLTN